MATTTTHTAAQAVPVSRPAAERVASVDFFRGLTMFLLIGESTLAYQYFLQSDNPVLHFIGFELHHHEWHGLHFWDLIQPFFMTIVGVAIPFAVAARQRKGDTDRQILYHAIRRSLLLLFFGWALYCIGPERIVFRLQNVLAQLSVTYLVAFLIRKKSTAFQLTLTLVILLITDLAYRYFPVEGFNQPWTAFHNLGAWANNKIEGVEKADIWASINAFPTIAHTVWGVLIGRLLMSGRPPKTKIRILLTAAAIALAAGYSLDWLNITPIIKKIATAAFVFASAGWTILALTVCYWLIDVKQLGKRTAHFFIIVGMNSIFIYLFFEVGSAKVINGMFRPFTRLLFSWTGNLTFEIMTSLAVWMAMWYLCYWLYKKRIFFKI
jgi:predicted acyltransferase